MEAHKPVLLEDVLKMVSAGGFTPQTYLDATFGRGGHYKAIYEKFPQLKTVAFDQDADAVEYAKKTFEREIAEEKLMVIKSNFVDLEEHRDKWQSFIGKDKFDLILVDLGVSSPQLDESDRGFSFYCDGPLDMRMNQDQSLSAEEIINEWQEQELSDLFYNYGEIKFPNKVVRAIVDQRKKERLTSTIDLASLIERVSGWRKKGKHPATQYFLALRLVVNAELEVIEKSLPILVENLPEGGRLLVITFHSTEDRKVKYGLRELKTLGSPINKKVIQASYEEVKSNPRSRSAKLRGFERGVVK